MRIKSLSRNKQGDIRLNDGILWDLFLLRLPQADGVQIASTAASAWNTPEYQTEVKKLLSRSVAKLV
jgi:hypothetical protein